MSRLRVIREGSGHPVHGLPGPLPPGEAMLWQGAPDALVLARRALHVRKIGLYFAVLALWCAVRALASGNARLWYSMLALIVLGMLATALLGGFAWLVARSTVYTLTERRVVLRIGVALPMSINLPFCMIDQAAVRLYADGSGDIPLLLDGPNRIGVSTLWPHVRPWRLRRVQPMLRAVPDAARVAALLSRALAASAGQPAPVLLDQAPAGAAGKRPLRGEWPASVGA